MTQSPEEFPSITEQGKNLTKFTFEVVKDALTVSEPQIYASKELQKERLSICHSCDYYHIKQNRCRHCGCWLDHKVKFQVTYCPIQKW